MNILAYQDISRVEEYLMTLNNSEAYPLILPSGQDLSHLHIFESQLFKQVSSKNRAILDKKLVTHGILVSIAANQENGMVRMFIYNLLVVIYGPLANKLKPNIRHTFNQDLLNNFKCSLYSKDIKFSLIQNSKNTLKNDQQGKILAVRFFKLLEDFQKTVEDQRLTVKYIQWVLQHNQILLQIFVLLMRFILTKLQVKGAIDYNYQLRPEDAIINLIEYFDLSYRCSDGLVLFYQEGYFLTFVAEEALFGQYNQKTEIQCLKADNEKTVQAQIFKKSQSQATKKSQNKQNQMKHFLTSSSQSESYENSCFEKRQTFSAKQSKRFQIQRIKEGDVDSANEENLIKQFSQVISDSDYGSQLDNYTENLKDSNNLSTPPTPTWFKQASFVPQKSSEKDFRSTVELSRNIFRRKKNMDSIHQVDEGLQKIKKRQSEQIQIFNTGKNLVKVIERGFKPFTPQALQKGKNSEFWQIADEDMGFFLQNTQSLYNLGGQKIQKRSEFLQKIDASYIECQCRYYRIMRNACHSKIVDFVFQPQQTSKQVYSSYLPKKNSMNAHKFGPQIKVTPPKQPKNIQLKYSQAREDRIPSFIKSKKEKTSHSSKEAKSIVKRQSSKQKKEKSKDLKKGQTFKRYSEIIFHPKQKHSHSNSGLKNCPQQGFIFKKYDVKQQQAKPSMGQLMQSWKKDSNGFNSPTYNQSKSQLGQFMKQNQKSNAPFRVFAPVPTIAPTEYLHSNNRSDSKVIFSVNKQNQKYNRFNDLSASKGPNIVTGPKNELISNRSEKILNSFQKNYL